MLKNLLNHKNFSNPLVEYYDKVFNEFDYERENFDRVYFNTADIRTDSGILMKDWKGNEFLEYHSLVRNTGKLKDRTFYYFDILFTNIRSHYQRDYIKIQIIAAKVGGFMNLFFQLICFFWTNYMDNLYITYLIEKLFTLEIEEVEPINPLKSPKFMNYCKIEHNIELAKASGENEIHDLSSKIQLKSLDLPSPVKNNSYELQNLVDFKKRNKKEVHITFRQRCGYNYCCFEKKLKSVESEEKMKYELMKGAENEIKEKIEIANLLKVTDQFRLLRKILLNENQCYMMEKREKHCIRIKEEGNYVKGKMKSLVVRNLKNEKKSKKCHMLNSYLTKKIKENSMTDVDNLLYQYLDKDTKMKIPLEKVRSQQETFRE